MALDNASRPCVFDVADARFYERDARRASVIVLLVVSAMSVVANVAFLAIIIKRRPFDLVARTLLTTCSTVRRRIYPRACQCRVLLQSMTLVSCFRIGNKLRAEMQYRAMDGCLDAYVSTGLECLLENVPSNVLTIIAFDSITATLVQRAWATARITRRMHNGAPPGRLAQRPT